MLANIPNKRKSFGNKNDTPQSAKKFKQGASPNKPNGTPQGTPNQQQKQKNTPGKGITPGKKQQQASPGSIKKESPKTPKLEMFSGTSNLNSSKNASTKKEAISAKKPNNVQKQQAGGKKGPVNQAKQNVTSNTDAQPNRHKRRREALKHKRQEIRDKFNQLRIKVSEGDQAARREVEEKIQELEKAPVKSKNCLKKLRSLQGMLSNKTKTNKNDQQQKKNQKNQQIKEAPKSQQINQKKQAAPQNKQNQPQKGKQNQNLKITKDEQEESDSEEDEEVSGEEASDVEEEASSDEAPNLVLAEEEEEASDDDDDDDEEEEAAASDEDEEEQQGSSDDEEGSGEEDEEEEGSGEEEEDSEDGDNQVVQQKNKQPAKTQGGNKNKQDTKLDDADGKGKSSRYVVFVGNLPYTATKDELTEHFKKVGNLVDIRIPTDQNTKKPRGFAYIELKDEEGYQRALSLNHTFIGGRRINVLYTQGGKKKNENQKGEIKAKNLKLQAMRNKGQLAGSTKADQKRSVRRAKKQQFEKRREGA